MFLAGLWRPLLTYNLQILDRGIHTVLKLNTEILILKEFNIQFQSGINYRMISFVYHRYHQNSLFVLMKYDDGAVFSE